MDGSGDVLLLLLLLLIDLLFNWIKAVLSAAIAVLVRHRMASAIAAAAVGAIEGLVGSRLELLDVYLTRDGWESIDALTLATVVLSAAASLVWWAVARALYAWARRAWRPGAHA